MDTSRVKYTAGAPIHQPWFWIRKIAHFAENCAKKGAPVFRCVKRLFIIDEMALWIVRTAPKCFSGSRTLSGHPRNQSSSALRTCPCSIWLDNGVVFCSNLFYMSCFLFNWCVCKLNKKRIKLIHFFIWQASSHLLRISWNILQKIFIVGHMMIPARQSDIL